MLVVILRALMYYRAHGYPYDYESHLTNDELKEVIKETHSIVISKENRRGPLRLRSANYIFPDRPPTNAPLGTSAYASSTHSSVNVVFYGITESFALLGPSSVPL
jgi:hypothetical protein